MLLIQRGEKHTLVECRIPVYTKYLGIPRPPRVFLLLAILLPKVVYLAQFELFSFEQIFLNPSLRGYKILSLK